MAVTPKPFMRCTKCGRYGDNWLVSNEAYSCPICRMDESGLELIDPWSLIGKFFTGRQGRVRIIDYWGGNTFSTLDSRDIRFTSSILALKEIP